MAIAVVILSLFIAFIGALGVVAPKHLVGLVKKWPTSTVLYSGAVFRVVLGLALFFAAPSSKAPDVLRVLGVVIVVAGLAMPFLGIERFRRLIEWWSARGCRVIRGWACCALAIGLLLAYAVMP